MFEAYRTHFVNISLERCLLDLLRLERLLRIVCLLCGEDVVVILLNDVVFIEYVFK